MKSTPIIVAQPVAPTGEGFFTPEQGTSNNAAMSWNNGFNRIPALHKGAAGPRDSLYVYTTDINLFNFANYLLVRRSSHHLRQKTLSPTGRYWRVNLNLGRQIRSNHLLCVPFLQPMKWAQCPRNHVPLFVSVPRPLLTPQTRTYKHPSPQVHYCRGWRTIARKAQRHAHARP